MSQFLQCVEARGSGGPRGPWRRLWVLLEHFLPMPLFYSLLEVCLGPSRGESPAQHVSLLSLFRLLQTCPSPRRPSTPVGPSDALSAALPAPPAPPCTCRVHLMSRISILLAISIGSVIVDLLSSLSSVFFTAGSVPRLASEAFALHSGED